MKLRLAMIGLAAVGVILLVAFLVLRPGGAQRDAEATRQLLRQQGFKTDLDQFDFSTTPEMRNRAVPLTTSGMIRRSTTTDMLDLMAPVGSNAALVLWQLDKLPSSSAEDGWPALRESLAENHASLDAACGAALSGPIRFNLNAGAGAGLPLRHLAGLKYFAQSFGSRAVLELHDRNKNAAWTNLLAATRLVTAWEPEPTEVSHLVRFNCAELAFKTTWEMLQTGGWEWQTLQTDEWDDARLADLQREWEAVDFFKGLPETAAFTRASMVAACQLNRKQPAAGVAPLKDLIQSPRYAWASLSAIWQQFRYRHRGTYEDEKALLLYYRDRELQLRQAAQCPSWREMRQFPGVTNAAPFRSKYPSGLQALSNVRQLNLSFQFRGSSLLGRAAEAEARRRLLVTALALERFHGRHGSYPKTLAELSPGLLNNPPADFMDGQPLRYRPTDDGHFVLYSVGLDCVDDGGQLAQPIGPQVRFPNLPKWPMGVRRYNGAFMGGAGNEAGTDLVWARPASAAEVKAQQDEERRQEEQRQAAEEAEANAEEKTAELARRATVQKLLDEAQPRSHAKEPTFQGKPLSRRLRNDKVLGANQPTLDELLTARQVITGDEPGSATFELPLNYDVVTNLGELGLVVDGRADQQEVLGDNQTCERATNGNCRVVWDTTYDPPGQHVVQARFVLRSDEPRNTLTATGPVVPYVSSNLFQFSSRYDDKYPNGMTFYAKLVETTGIYTIEIQSLPRREHLHTITGVTTNGIMNEHWNMTDDGGHKHTDEAFNIVYDIHLPGSGRSQKVK